MKGSTVRYLFYAFQVLVGAWLFISPFALSVPGVGARVSNMIFGAIVVILGVGFSLAEYYTHELIEQRETELRHVEQKA